MNTDLLLRAAGRACLAVLLASLALPVLAQQSPLAERVAALKVTVAASKVALRQYEWVETTVVTLKGKEASRKQERCSYGADGKVTKVLLTPPPEKPLKESRSDYIKKAIGLMRVYFPLDDERMWATKRAGDVSLQLVQPDKCVRLTFNNYLKSGDRLSVDVDPVNNRPLGANVSTYQDSEKDVVTLAVKFSTLNEGAFCISDMTLDAVKQKLKVTVENSGYRKL
jgi:hypothetical protein